jgi:quercetin dioxygenase-like cupin family protein
VYITDLNKDIMCKSASGNSIYWMITSEIGAKNFEMRYIEIPVKGNSSYGSHPHEHEVFIIKGKGVIKGKDSRKELKPNDAVFVLGGEEHQWLNTGNEPFGFICVVPKGAEAESKPPCIEKKKNEESDGCQ